MIEYLLPSFVYATSRHVSHKLAQGMNYYGERIVELSEIRSAWQRALDSGMPAVLDVAIDKEAMPPDFQLLASLWQVRAPR